MSLIQSVSKDATINVSYDTVVKKKQALVFVSSKRSAQKVALDISKVLKEEHIQKQALKELSKQVLGVLSSPTDQCKKLAYSVERGVAFHHAGLAGEQKQLIESAFSKGLLPLIVCTPTLAAGLDLPAFRTILRDMKRYTGSWGMQYIAVLEYLQMAGRAGRPGKESFGEAIMIAKNQNDAIKLYETFICGEVEPIYSKLAVEPVLRTYVLSLLATGLCKTQKQLSDFFSQTFWAYQYKDMAKLEQIIFRVIGLLTQYGFLEKKDADFLDADQLDQQSLQVTPLGRRVSQLYLDPLSAHMIVEGLQKPLHTFGLIHLFCMTNEMQPRLRVKQSELESVHGVVLERESTLLIDVPTLYDPQYSDYLEAIKTSCYFEDWISELSEDQLLKKYDIRPGEIHAKNEIIDWLLYCATQLAQVLHQTNCIKQLTMLRTRIKYGAKEELLPLLQLKSIGRVRARTLFSNGVCTLADLREVAIEKLVVMVGKQMAISLKKQVGQEVSDHTQGTLFSFDT
ncbi:MAG: helicase-related protein [Candidatus Woesearchaeota archaeon]